MNQVDTPEETAGEEMQQCGEDYVLVKTPDSQFNVDDLLEHLRFSLQVGVVRDLVRSKLLEKVFLERRLEASAEEVDQAITNFRVSRQLLTREKTVEWLEEQFLSQSDLREIVEKEIKLSKLRDSLFDEDAVQEHFAMKKSGLAKVSFYQIVVSQERKASELVALIKTGRSFFDLARQHSEDEDTRAACGYAGINKLSDLEPEIHFRIATASEGDIIGPIKSLGKYYLLFIDRNFPAVFDHETKESIHTELFDSWVEQLVKTTPFEILL